MTVSHGLLGAIQVLGALLILAIFGPFYLVLIIIAIWFGWSEKRKLRLARVGS